ncbi:MAG: DNA methyltransferase [Nanoarchaeota archaeon]
MEDYLFVLGRDRELSFLELICYLNRKNIKYNIKDKWNDLVLVSLNDNVNIEELGGIIKIAKVILKSKNKKEILNKIEIPNKNKVYYSVNDDSIKEILNKRFKEEQIKAFYKSDVNDPSTAMNLDLELIYFRDYLAKVIQISNPKSYKKRDETRPRFDERKVISIRLAKILINLSQAKNEILDPFCGAGTILQEALLLGLDAYGLDINIQDSKENLSWLTKNFNIKNKYKLFQGDSQDLTKYIHNVEAVVTEPYLGPYLKTYPKHEEAKYTILRLQSLYKKVFSELNKITNKIVIIFPIIIAKDKKRFHIDINLILSKTNFKVANHKIKLPLLYKHKGSILEREIWIFEKSKL